MKKNVIIILGVLLLVLVILAGCGGGNNNPTPTPTPTTVPTSIPTSAPTPTPTSVPTLIPTSAPTPTPSGVLDVTEGLVVYYPFNNVITDAKGLTTPYANHVTLTSDRFGNSNKACAFSGAADSYISLAPSPFSITGTGFTISLWIKSYSGQNVYPMYCSLVNFRQEIGATNNFSFGVGSSSPLTLNGTVSANTWTHLLGTYDNTTKNGSLYINGVLISSGTKSSTLTSFDFGGFQFGFTNWIGSIDDFRIYNRVLSASEINQLYNYSN